jgi:hypothetical protein
MGSEASKPIDPPKDWEPKGASKSFQIISPVSDISNPSEIHRFHPKPSRTLLAQRGTGSGNNGQQQPRRLVPSNRRVSKTAATSLPPQAVSRNERGHVSDIMPPSAFYFPTKESERYVEQHMKVAENDDDGDNNNNNYVATAVNPSSNKENNTRTTKNDFTEKNKTMGGGIRKQIYKVMTGCLADDQYDDEIQLQNPPNVQQQQCKVGVEIRPDTKKDMSKPRRRLAPKEGSRGQSVQSGGGEDEQAAFTSKETSSGRDIYVHSTSDVPLRKIKMDSSENQQPQNGNRKVLSKATIVKTIVSDVDEAQGQFKNGISESDHLDDVDSIASLALHQEDAYFNRLSMSSTHEASPFISHESNTIASSTLDCYPSNQLIEKSVIATPAETKKAGRRSMPESLDTPIDTPSNEMTKKPMRKSFPVSVDTPIDTPESQSSQPFTRRFLQDPMVSLLQKGDDNRNALPISSSKDDSPVSSLLRFYTKTGPMESSPAQSFRSEEDSLPIRVFSDEVSESSSQQPFSDLEQYHMKKEAILKRESQVSHSSLYTVDTKNYGNIDGKSLQLVGSENAIHQANPEVLSYFSHAESKEERLASHPSKKVAFTKNPINQVAKLAPAKSTWHEHGGSKNKISKLESLFRPVLPALSSDDANSVTSYDPYEIKVTESAPGMIQSEHYISLALRKPSPRNSTAQFNQRASFSPSMVSIDSQRQQSPTLASVMISDQAECNAEFLFVSDYGPVVNGANPTGDRDRAISAISTSGARSRLTQRSLTESKGVVIPVPIVDNESRTGRSSIGSYKSERRVRFSTETVKLAKMRDSISSITSRSTLVEAQDANVPESEEMTRNFTENTEVHPSRDSGIMSARLSDATSMQPSISESIDLPEIERIVSDVTEEASVKSRRSTGSSSMYSIHETIQEEDEKAELSPETSIHWTYSENGVTPYVKGKPIENGAKSPFIRFTNAKNTFSVDDSMNLPTRKSPKTITNTGSGGIVSARIEELNSRVSEIRKIKRMQKKTTNPRLHTHNFDNKQPVRSRALLNYKTSIKSADTGKSNTVMAAKFNVIPDVDDDDLSSLLAPGPNTQESPRFADGDDNDDDDVSKLSEAMSSIACSSVATVRQERSGSLRSRTYSETSATTASSGFINIKKQVFRASDASRSLTSNGDSTTLSVIIQKENESYLPFRAGTFHTSKQSQQYPSATTQQTPMQAMKWRSLAMAAQEKDALKTGDVSSKKPARGLSLRAMNV